MAHPEMLFWLDVESTGLLEDPTPPTILEMAWTITDADGTQLTPLRQRFTALTAVQASFRMRRQFELATPEDDGDGGGVWDEDRRYPSPPVREMHARNGLADEWVRADGSTPWRVLRAWTEVERLWLDDMSTAGMPLARDFLLAGAGVSHYEHRFVLDRAPRVFTSDRFHYAVCDVSTVLRTLHLADERWPKKSDAALALGRAAGEAGLDVPAEWMSVDIDAGAYDADDALEIESWGDYDRDPHRAGVGIARALMAYRLLPRIAGWLDAGLVVPEPEPVSDPESPAPLDDAALSDAVAVDLPEPAPR